MADAGPTPDANTNAMAVSPAGKDDSDPDKTAAKKALFQATPEKSDKTENALTPATGEKRNSRENNIVILRGCDPIMKPDNEQMGDVCKQLHFNIEEAQATAMKDILLKHMAEMKTKQMAEMEEMKTVIAQQRAKHMAEMEEMKAVIEQQRAIVEQQRAWMDNLILTLKNFMKHEEQEQEKQQGEQEQEQVQRGRSRCRGRSSRRRSSSPSVQGDPCRSLPCAARAGLC